MPLRVNAIKSRLSLFFILLGLALPGCRTGYLLHAGTGQIKLLYGSVEIEKALESDLLSPRQKEQLRLVNRVKTFGESELGLKKTENYNKIYLDSRQPPIFLVCACPKDRFENKTWWFPIVGEMPYIGFFDLQSARAEEEKLRKQNLDVYIGLADAYSSLGWFKDPVTLNLLDESANSLGETILHEMTHVTFFLRGRSGFNEGLAVMTGLYGALAFFRKNFGDSHPFTLEAQMAINDEALFSLFLSNLLNRLEKLYASSLKYDEKLKKREEIFSGALERFTHLENKLQTNRFKNFEGNKINNAFLMVLALYHGHFNDFQRLLTLNNGSIKDTIHALKTMTAEEIDTVVNITEY